MISVIVPFAKSETHILDCLKSIYDADYPNDHLDVILIDNAHDDSLYEAIRCYFPDAKVIREASLLGCDASKQAGIDAASGEVIAFTDSDCTVDSCWMNTIVQNLADGADVVTGPVHHPHTLLRELVGISDFSDFQAATRTWVSNFPGCNFATRRETFAGRTYYQSGEMQFGSDRLVSWRLHMEGFKIRYDMQMTVRHFPPVNVASLVERRLRYGRKALALRMIEPTLPGGGMARLGLLAVPGYVSYKIVKDVCCMSMMATRHAINPWHAPLLFPMLAAVRILDGFGMTLAYRQRRYAP